ncbi:MAG: GNAT family protein [Actinomycetota bacterium]
MRVAPVHEADLGPYRRAVEQSRARVARWNPVDPDDLARALKLQSRGRRTFIIHALNPEGDHDIVGRVNISDVVRGRFESAAMGYDSYDPYAGRGLFADGLRQVLNLIFAPDSAGGMGLHRVQAAVQPGNVRSAGLLRSLGFRREGFSPRMLWLPDPSGNDAWCDHDSYALLADEWPGQPYRTPQRRKVVALVNGAPGCGAATALARQLSAELAIPLFSTDVTGEGGSGTLWALLADSPVGGVVAGCFGQEDARSVVEGLRRCGVDPATVPEIRCFPAEAQVPSGGLGLGPKMAVDVGPDLGPGDVVRIALDVAQGAPR